MKAFLYSLVASSEIHLPLLLVFIFQLQLCFYVFFSGVCLPLHCSMHFINCSGMEVQSAHNFINFPVKFFTWYLGNSNLIVNVHTIFWRQICWFFKAAAPYEECNLKFDSRLHVQLCIIFSPCFNFNDQISRDSNIWVV